LLQVRRRTIKKSKYFEPGPINSFIIFSGVILMNVDSAKTSPPVWFWVISVLALLWYLVDMSAFFLRVLMTDDVIKTMPEQQQQFLQNIPLWVNIVFAGEVFGGTLGSIALLLRKKWALPLFVVSILGVLSQTLYLWFLTDHVSAQGASAVVMPLMALLIVAGIIVFTKSAISKGWLR